METVQPPPQPAPYIPQPHPVWYPPLPVTVAPPPGYHQPPPMMTPYQPPTVDQPPTVNRETQRSQKKKKKSKPRQGRGRGPNTSSSTDSSGPTSSKPAAQPRSRPAPAVSQQFLTKDPKIPDWIPDSTKSLSFEAWAKLVRQFTGTHDAGVVKRGALAALKGRAGTMALNLDDGDTPLDDILDKLAATFGAPMSRETMLKRYYSMEQAHKEPLTDFAARLQEMHAQIQTHYPNSLPADQDSLKTRFLEGVLEVYKTRYTFLKDDPRVDMYACVARLRGVEESTKAKAASRAAILEETNPLESLTAKVEKQGAQLQTLFSQQRQARQSKSTPEESDPDPEQLQEEEQDAVQTQAFRPQQGRQQGWGAQPSQRPRPPVPSGGQEQTQRPPVDSTWQCYNCRGFGHLQKDCPTPRRLPPPQPSMQQQPPVQQQPLMFLPVQQFQLQPAVGQGVANVQQAQTTTPGGSLNSTGLVGASGPVDPQPAPHSQ